MYLLGRVGPRRCFELCRSLPAFLYFCQHLAKEQNGENAEDSVLDQLLLEECCGGVSVCQDPTVYPVIQPKDSQKTISSVVHA